MKYCYLLCFLFFFISHKLLAQTSYEEKSIISYSEQAIEKEGASYYVIKFFATWCLPCIGEIPDYNKTVIQYQSKDLKFITISDEKDVGKLKRVLQKFKVEGLWFSDVERRLFTKYNITYIPHYVLIDMEYKQLFSGSLFELKEYLKQDDFSKGDKQDLQEIPHKFNYKLRAKHTDRTFGESSTSIGKKRTSLEFKKYSALTLIGVQLHKYNLPSILCDTSDFMVDVSFIVDTNNQDVVTELLDDKLKEKLGYMVKPVVKKDTVWYISSTPKASENLGKLYKKGWILGSDSLYFVNQDVKALQFAIENNWHTKILYDESISQDVISFVVKKEDSWEALKNNLIEKGFIIEKKYMDAAYLAIYFKTKNQGNLKSLFFN